MIEKFTIATVAEQSKDFRRVLWTGKDSQLVIMTIPPGGEIGEETHPHTDQILTFVSGTGEAVVAGESEQIAQGDLVVVPAGTSTTSATPVSTRSCSTPSTRRLNTPTAQCTRRRRRRRRRRSQGRTALRRPDAGVHDDRRARPRAGVAGGSRPP
ncbi:MAG TPA: cupin domain-containing protein [Actinophytocola sp.]|nr:cupin domain-containing protein [Actinophytocola sp.]